MEKAIFELSEKLRHPSDIGTKLAVVEKTAKSDYEHHEEKFREKMAQGYGEIEAVRSKIARLSAVFQQFWSDETSAVEILRNFKALIRNYESVKTVCKTHQRFLKIKGFLESLQSAEESCAAEDVLEYHKAVYAKEEFMCELVLYNDGLSQENYARVQRAIGAITKTSAEFTTVLVELASDIRANQESLRHLNEIVSREEARDELTRQANEGDEGKDPELQEIARMYPQYVMRKPKELRRKIVAVIRDAIRGKFAEIDTSQAYVGKLDFVLEDIAFVHGMEQLDFFGLDEAIEEYHTSLKRLIDSTLERLDAGEILALIEYKTNYYNTIEARYGRVAEALGPRLVDNEEELLEIYARTASSKLGSWIENITTAEIEKFQTRDGELSKDEDGHLVSTGFISLLQLIKVQLEPIAFSKKVFLHMANAVKSHCAAFRTKIVAEVKHDYKRVLANKHKPGFEDYCIMFGNSGLLLTQYITSLPQCQSPEIRDLGNTFIDILHGSNHILAKYVMHVSAPAVAGFFTDGWENAQQVFVVTLEDFLEDYTAVMADFSFTTFVLELCSAILKAYVGRLCSKQLRLKSGQGAGLKRDHDAILGLVLRYVEKETAEEALAPLLRLAPILDATSEELILVEVKSLKLADSGIKCDELISIIDRRRDLAESFKRAIFDKIKDVFKEKRTKRKPKTFVSRFLSGQ
ncbi:exocyst complex component 3 [Pancytospora philotis]|nr:exocyst complex component 3 [Pancytospora philotis]